ncbi:helix-turn-helix domain-containing protein [Knoellia koreensis]|uniref:helix-turn-helix domain-containing protein n=1 Tax=Knoellia koreensis TaxID=2730921 RepID=UPI00197CC2BD|nr:helix-turn-helix domain-containing protein [Knoellia sp. DB2414S]
MTPDQLRSRLTVTVPEAGRALGIGRDAAYAAAERGEIPTLRLGRRLVVPTGRLLELLGIPQTDSEAGPASPTVATTEPVEGAHNHGDTARLRSA